MKIIFCKTFHSNGIKHSDRLKNLISQSECLKRVCDSQEVNCYESRHQNFVGGGRHSSMVSFAPTLLQPRVRIPSTPSTLIPFEKD